MKIRVIRATDHREEVISIIEPCSIQEGDYLSRIRSAEGMEHFFTPDGYYDGWGKAISVPTLEEAANIIASIESERDIQESK